MTFYSIKIKDPEGQLILATYPGDEIKTLCLFPNSTRSSVQEFTGAEQIFSALEMLTRRCDDPEKWAGLQREICAEFDIVPDWLYTTPIRSLLTTNPPKVNQRWGTNLHQIAQNLSERLKTAVMTNIKEVLANLGKEIAALKPDTPYYGVQRTFDRVKECVVSNNQPYQSYGDFVPSDAGHEYSSIYGLLRMLFDMAYASIYPKNPLQASEYPRITSGLMAKNTTHLEPFFKVKSICYQTVCQGLDTTQTDIPRTQIAFIGTNGTWYRDQEKEINHYFHINYMRMHDMDGVWSYINQQYGWLLSPQPDLDSAYLHEQLGQLIWYLFGLLPLNQGSCSAIICLYRALQAFHRLPRLQLKPDHSLDFMAYFLPMDLFVRALNYCFVGQEPINILRNPLTICPESFRFDVRHSQESVVNCPNIYSKHDVFFPLLWPSEAFHNPLLPYNLREMYSLYGARAEELLDIFHSPLKDHSELSDACRKWLPFFTILDMNLDKLLEHAALFNRLMEVVVKFNGICDPDTVYRAFDILKSSKPGDRGLHGRYGIINLWFAGKITNKEIETIIKQLSALIDKAPTPPEQPEKSRDPATHTAYPLNIK